MNDIIVNFLLSQDRSDFNVGRTNILMRCPVCGDPTSKTSRNFSVKINVEENEPMVYQCFRASCQASGYLDIDFIQRYLHCNDMKVILELSKHNSKLIKKRNKLSKLVAKDLNLVNLKNEQNEQKLKYINKRLGLDLSIKDLKKLKIQLDLKEFIKMNNIKAKRKESEVDFLSKNTIGFVSSFNDYIICRYVVKSEIRYINFKLHPDIPDDEKTKIYTIPVEIDLLSAEASTLHIAEGPISILGGYFHAPYKYPGNNIYSANCGGGYYKTIATLCKQYGLTKIRIVIYSDSEIKLDFYKQLYNRIKDDADVAEFIILYNTKSDDFGHPSDNISVRIEEIK